jgi:hypothetical protein
MEARLHQRIGHSKYPASQGQTHTADDPMQPTQETAAPTADDDAMQSEPPTDAADLQLARDDRPPEPPVAGLPVTSTEPAAMSPSGVRILSEGEDARDTQPS